MERNEKVGSIWKFKYGHEQAKNLPESNQEKKKISKIEQLLSQTLNIKITYQILRIHIYDLCSGHMDTDNFNDIYQFIE